PPLKGRRRLASVYIVDNTGLEVPTTFAGGDSSCAGEIPACQSFVSMASGDLKGKMNYRVWPVSSIAMPEATNRAGLQPTTNPGASLLSHSPSWPRKQSWLNFPGRASRTPYQT
ncbi:hypothetical protein, partial [Stenotrophomonas maltophilia]|uniref:hypothetical protein n=1 Tax=Stenotrophomonas maltophilia TaxID=40324 RepID=UPI0019553D12